MKIDAPAREEVGTWDATIGRFVDHPEPPSRWLQRALTEMYGTEPRRSDIIDPVVRIGTEFWRELFQEIRGIGMTDTLTVVYGCRIEVDHDLDVPFRLTWTSREEAIRASAVRGLRAWGEPL